MEQIIQFLYLIAKQFYFKGKEQGRRNWGAGGARGAKVPFQFKGLPWRNSELSEMLVQFFYEFTSENARNAVIELQE